MRIDKSIIKQRKALYGDNFQKIADGWNKYFKLYLKDKDIEPKDVALLMALMKDVRIDATNELLKYQLSASTRDKLVKALEDSITDSENYRWIARNFEEYKSL